MEKEELLKLIKEEFYRIKPSGCSDFFDKRDKRIPCLRKLQKTFNGATYNGILILAGVSDYDLKSLRRYKEELLEKLKVVIRDLGYIPSQNQYEKLGCCHKTISKYFESWENAIKEAGYENYKCKEKAEVKENNEELLQMYIDYSNKIGRPAMSKDLNNNHEIYNSGVFKLRFGGLDELKKLAGFELCRTNYSKYSKKEITNILIDKILIQNRYLTMKEIKEDKDLPNPTTILKHFKTTKISDVYKEIGTIIKQRYINIDTEVI